MTALNTALMYCICASIATAVNLLTQEATISFVNVSYSLEMAIVAGTATGLISKYFLDKRFVFKNESTTARNSLAKFGAYSLTGVFTTLLFWGFEFSFDNYFGTKFARYSGAVIGLTIGYGIKYRLDKRFVFNS
ncbi:MAG: putative flippase GtrA [Pseudohongiellaceae bacterium]|jgi:putative flippase GtrA